MDKGVRGFRFDVVILISKAAFEDDETGDGRKYYTDGPNIHKYLKELAESHPSVFAYRRTYEGHELIVAANFYGRECCWKDAPDLSGFEKLTGNYHEETAPENGEWTLKPYEAQVWYK